MQHLTKRRKSCSVGFKPRPTKASNLLQLLQETLEEENNKTKKEGGGMKDTFVSFGIFVRFLRGGDDEAQDENGMESAER